MNVFKESCKDCRANREKLGRFEPCGQHVQED